MRSFLQDIRHSLRRLRREPGLSVVVIATVAAGIAASATVFALIDALFWKPLPGIVEQSRLVNVHATAPDGSTFHSVSYPTWRDLGNGGGSFSGLAAFSSRLVSLSEAGEPKLAIAQIVTGNYFQVLGARPELGRFFGPSEDAVPGRDAVVVLSDGVWKTRFAADPSIIGRTVSLNGHSFTVVGVARPRFVGTFLGFPFDIWVPTMMAPTLSVEEGLEARSLVWLEMVGRLAPGVSLEAARRRMAVLAGRLAGAYPDSERGIGYDLRPVTGFEDSLRGAAVGFFTILAVLAGLVLAVACVNVTGILLARAFAREREIGVRMALGARRPRLIRLLLAETLVLFAAGGGLGALLTTATAPQLERFRLPIAVPITFDFSPGPRVAAFALLAALAGGLLLGLLTAVSATRAVDPAALRAGASTDRRRASRLRSIFVSLQVAAAVLLLVTAGLFLRTVRHAAATDPGFDPRGVYLTNLDLSMLGYDAGKARAFFDRLLERARGWPGVESAAVTGLFPLGPGTRNTTVRLPGRTAPEDEIPVDFADVGESFFSTMRIPILRGRAFQATDAPGGPTAAIINETLARRLWPGREPIGQTLTQGTQTLTVVGVARDGKYRRPWEEPRAYLYLAFRQQGRLRENVVVRTSGSRESVAAALASEVRRLEPALPTSALISATEHMGFSLLPQRVAGVVAGALGAVGLALSAIGLAGLVAYSVSRRTREIGLRMALGAQTKDVLRLEMRRGIRAAVVGLVLGTAAALLSTRLLSGLLFGVRAIDPLTFGAVLLLLAATTVAASYLPARRAARVSPTEALRSE
jgi:macrolide transport system ATP-binding/permease protein